MNPVENILAKMARLKADTALCVDQSDCCGGELLGSSQDPICSKCKEHCESVTGEPEGSTNGQKQNKTRRCD